VVLVLALANGQEPMLLLETRAAPDYEVQVLHDLAHDEDYVDDRRLFVFTVRPLAAEREWAGDPAQRLVDGCEIDVLAPLPPEHLDPGDVVCFPRLRVELRHRNDSEPDCYRLRFRADDVRVLAPSDR
jgi:hypothetical protein